MKRLTLIIILVSTLNTFAQNSLITPYEKSGKTETMTYEEIIEWSYILDSLSNNITHITYGKSGNGYDLPMLIADKDGLTTAAEVRASKKAVLLIEAGIHAGEPDGTDAGFLLFRDFVNGDISIPSNVCVLFIPSVNVDGCIRRSKYNRINQNGPLEMGWRTTADYNNLNRDFLKAEAVEMQAWHTIFNEWEPDFFIDCHTTDGADYQYAVTYDLSCLGNMNKEQTDWQIDNYLNPLIRYMDKKDIKIFRYVTFKNWHDPRSGLKSWIASPMLSEGYSAIRNRPALLIETHMLKPYDIRVDATYQILLKTVDIMDKDYKKLIEINNNADRECESADFRNEMFPLSYVTSEDTVIEEFLGVKYSISKSDLSGGLWFKYSSIDTTFKIAHYNNPVANKYAEIPAFYIYPPVWKDVTELLDIHQVDYKLVDSDTLIEVELYKFFDVELAGRTSEGRTKVNKFSIDTLYMEVLYPKGSILINSQQKRVKVAAHILEPNAPSSLFKWGYFNRILEQKEYAESYVMEPLAREMLANDPEVAAEFAKMMENYKQEETDSEFVTPSWELLNWFYQQTEYWDFDKNLYPVGKIY